MRARPDLVVNVLDATNLERNLYLTVQILETEAPLLVVLNMQDLATRRGVGVDCARLSRLLADTPVLTAAAARGHGLRELREAIWTLTRAAANGHSRGPPIFVCEHGAHGVLCHCHN